MMAGNERDIAPFDFAAHLRTPDEVREFLQDALDDDDPEAFVVAMGHAARALELHRTGVATGGVATGGTASTDMPRFDAVAKLLDSMGLRLRLEAKADAHAT